jgi:hypothetical protein
MLIVNRRKTLTSQFGRPEFNLMCVTHRLFRPSELRRKVESTELHFFNGGKLAIMSHRGTVNGKPTYRSTHVWVKRGSMGTPPKPCKQHRRAPCRDQIIAAGDTS